MSKRAIFAVMLWLFVAASASAESAGEAESESPSWSYYAALDAYFVSDDD